MKREIFSCKAIVQPLLQNSDSIEKVKEWLAEKAQEHNLDYLLAHADDGVIWGRLDDEVLVTSFDAAKDDEEAQRHCPELRAVTLQQARLFSQNAELLLWRDGDNRWHARLIQDVEEAEDPAWEEAFNEPQMLWGDSGKEIAHNFTLLEEGAQGLRHAIPVPKSELREKKDRDGNKKLVPPRLVVRHYLVEDENGFARVDMSRLVNIQYIDGGTDDS